DKDYRELSQDIYRVDSLKDGHTLKEGDLAGNNNFKILKTEDNPDNGMQAMVSKRNGNVLVLNYKLRRFYDSKKESHHFIMASSQFFS
ncbi:TPA: hypothetical protein TVJ98_001985, partial [Streptococcus equi subsp. zooepidemicus]|nr:hypothetical protein [Streptococcus equi subsp. zooepidemicus]